MSSVAGLYGYPGLSVYCATKHALEGASAVMREELSKFNVPVITVQPGDFSKATHLLDNHHRYHASYRRPVRKAVMQVSCIYFLGFFRNMNEMWGEMSELQREEYKEYFITYHNGVAKSGVTGKRIKPVSVLPQSVIDGFEEALMTKVD